MTWWVATVQPSLEFRAEKGLHLAGIETWFPLRCVEVKGRHMKEPVFRAYPLFPGYLFVRYQGIGADTWQRIRSVEQVRGILSNSERPLSISDEWLSDRAKAMTCSIIKLVDDAWRIGDQVMISEGPLVSFTAFIAAITAPGCLKVKRDRYGDKQDEISVTWFPNAQWPNTGHDDFCGEFAP